MKTHSITHCFASAGTSRTLYLATMAMDGMEVVILDVRVPCTPVARLNNHRACVNGIAWAPHSSCHICTAADDHQALIWDIQQMPGPSRTLSWPIQLKERSTTCNGHRLSPTGLPSAITTAWRYSECSVGSALPRGGGLCVSCHCPSPK